MRLVLAPVVTVLVLLAGSVPFSPAAVAAPSPPGFAVYPLPSELAADAGEPSIGVNWNTGKVFFQSLATTIRTTFDDSSYPATATFEDVTPAFSVINVDPFLFTDTTSGRTFAGGITHGCSLMGYTDDDGASWTPMGEACALPAFDHESLASGPWRGAPPAGATSSRGVYYCAQTTVQVCSVSLDGGLTFRPAVVSAAGICAGHVFRVGVAPDGMPFVSQRTCDGGSKRGIAWSLNNGLTWTTRPVPGTSVGSGFDPAAAFAADGRMYYAWPDSNDNLMVTTTANPLVGAPTYSTPIDISGPAGIESIAFTSITVGDSDRAAIAFLGTTTPGQAFTAGFAGNWDLYVAFTYDAGASWQVTKVSTDPVHRGWICAGGIGCSAGRNLLDFFDAKIDKEGRVLVAFADGCIGACALPSGTAAQSTSALGTIARMSCGPSLFAAKGAVEGANACLTGIVGATGPTPLHGAYYARSDVPVENANAVVLAPTLSSSPPTSLTPSVFANAPGLTGTNAGAVYDAHWFLAAPSNGLKLDNQVVTAHIWIAAANVPPTARTNITVALYDAHGATFAPVTSHLRSQSVLVPLSTTPTEVIVTFPGVSAVLGNGLELFVGIRGVAEGTILYDSVNFPTRVVVS